MTTTYYVVPADRHFETLYPGFPNRTLAEREIAAYAAEGDDADYGIYEVKLVAGVGKTDWPGTTMHVRDGRKFIVTKAWAGKGYDAYCDDLGADDSPYGHGATPAEAIEECVDGIEAQKARVAAMRAARTAQAEAA